MIIRTVETCPVCGAINPWRQYAVKKAGIMSCEVVRRYVKCKVCGVTETISIRESNDSGWTKPKH